MLFLDDLWNECKNNGSLDRFSIRLFGNNCIDLYFSSAWPLENIKRALGLNISDNISDNNSWQVYSITKNEFDFMPYVNLFNRDQYCRLDIKGRPEIAAFYDSLNDIFRVYDLSQKLAVVICPSQPSFNEWEIHSPLREFFHIWALQHNALLIHSGVVSFGGKAVLLPGVGGSGKSTTTLSCLNDNMKTTGDDYNIIFNDNGRFKACSLYGNVKLKIPKQGQTSFDLPIINGWQSEELLYASKMIYFPPADSEIWEKNYPELVGVLCPVIKATENTAANITHIKMAELVNRLSISSIMQSPFMAKEYLAASVLLAKQVKIAYLNLSKDLSDNVRCIKKWMTTNS